MCNQLIDLPNEDAVNLFSGYLSNSTNKLMSHFKMDLSGSSMEEESAGAAALLKKGHNNLFLNGL